MVVEKLYVVRNTEVWTNDHFQMAGKRLWDGRSRS